VKTGANRCSFKRFRKVNREGAEVTSTGRAFQTRAPATEKARNFIIIAIRRRQFSYTWLSCTTDYFYHWSIDRSLRGDIKAPGDAETVLGPDAGANHRTTGDSKIIKLLKVGIIIMWTSRQLKIVFMIVQLLKLVVYYSTSLKFVKLATLAMCTTCW